MHRIAQYVILVSGSNPLAASFCSSCKIVTSENYPNLFVDTTMNVYYLQSNLGKTNTKLRRMMRLTNDCYLITLYAGNRIEYYYRDGDHWVKRSTRGRKFKATAEQVLNHLLPALSEVNSKVSIKVNHCDFDDATSRKLDELRNQQV